jgi:hypothetical protein
MKPNEHYMDYTGSSVYCQSQIEQVRLREVLQLQRHASSTGAAAPYMHLCTQLNVPRT